MKRYTLLTIIILAALLSPQNVQAQAPTFSFYRPHLNTFTGIALHNDSGWTPFTAAVFDTRVDGLYTLTDGVFYKTGTAAFSKITGNCRQDKVSEVGIRITIDGYSAPVEIAHTADEVFTFSFPFHSGNFVLEGYNYDLGRRDVLKCNIVIEALGV